MKIISLSILSITLSVSLFARLNPFEPTDHFLEQKEMILKANELTKVKKEQEEKNKISQEMELQKLAQEKLEAKKMAEAKMQEKKLAQAKAKKEALEMAKMQEEAKKQIDAKPSYIPEIKENFKILPFVKIYVVNDVLTIKVDKKYKLLNQDILRPAKKLLFDFEGKESFYTVRRDIISESFKSLAVGTHIEDNFFRVVIDLPSEVSNYREKIDSQNGIITIRKK